MTAPLTVTIDGGVAVVTLDDGKANAIGHATLEALDGVLDRIEAGGARALVIAGREGRFSAGFDLAAMTESTESMRALVVHGARFLMRLYGLGVPTVAACTGHALAAGALTLLSCDERFGADVPAKIGLNEVAIGMQLPIFAVELARDRLLKSHVGPATMAARTYDPAGAVAAGFLDAVVPAEQVVAAATERAGELAQLRTGAYARTKEVLRRGTIDYVLATVDDDMATVDAPTP